MNLLMGQNTSCSNKNFFSNSVISETDLQHLPILFCAFIFEYHYHIPKIEWNHFQKTTSNYSETERNKRGLNLGIGFLMDQLLIPCPYLQITRNGPQKHAVLLNRLCFLKDSRLGFFHRGHKLIRHYFSSHP